MKTILGMLRSFWHLLRLSRFLQSAPCLRQTDSFRVQRAIVIRAAPDKIFALINDFKACRNGRRMKAKDPKMQRRSAALDFWSRRRL